MNLGNLIEKLSQLPDNGVVNKGFGRPHSYRGYYEQLAFEPVERAKVSDMLAFAQEAVGQTFEGYKGGKFTMNLDTECWISEYGHASGRDIDETLLSLWKHELL